MGAMGKKSYWLRYGSLFVAAAATAVVLLVLAPAGVAEDEPPPPPTLTVSDASGSEGGSASFTVTLSETSSSVAHVHYATAGGSATQGQDFTETVGELNIPAGSLTGEIQVPLSNDDVDENDETFVLNLSEPSGATIGDGQGSGSITDTDAEPSISIADDDFNEGNADHTRSFAVTLSHPSAKTVKVDYFTEAGTATSDDDFARRDGTLEFAAGEMSKTIDITIKGDTTVESDETFLVNLRRPENATIADTQATGTIRNDDQHPARSISIADADADEGDGGSVKLSFTVSLDGPSTRPISVTATTSDGTARAPGDYAVKSQVLTFNAGQTSKVFEVLVAGDTLDEPDEVMNVTLSDPTNDATIADGEAVGRIYDHDANSVLSVSDSSANEPSSGTTEMTFTVTLQPASARLVQVGWSTANGTATAPTDYTEKVDFVQFAPGETTKSITVLIQGDTLNEPNETLFVNLGGVDGARIADPQGLGTIVDKSAPPSLAISDATGQEGQGATFTVTLTGTTTQTVTVRFSTSDGTATAPADYLARSGTLTFAPGEKTKSIAVTVVDDTASEPDESFSVTLGDPVNATLVKSRGQALIRESDRPLTPNPPNTPPPTPPPPPPPTNLVPRMVLSPKTVVVTGAGLVRLQLSCLRVSPVICRGTITLESVAAPKRALGKAAFTARPGKRVNVNVKLTPYGRGLLRKRSTLRVRVRMAVRSGTRVLKVSPGVIMLKVPKKDDITIPLP